MRLQGFIGPSNENRSWNFDKEDTINRYVELAEAGQPKSGGYLPPTPCVRPFLLLPEGPIRALFYQDGRCFAVANIGLYEIFASQTYTYLGTVNSDNLPATISSNGTAGHQLFIVSGGAGYIFDLQTNTFTRITVPGFPTRVVMGNFSDGFFIVLDNTGAFQLSALEDGTTWSGLDRFQVSEASDLVIAMTVSHREIWLFGTKTTEPWQDVGGAGANWQPTSGTLIETGIAAPWSMAVLDNTVFWVGGDERGNGIVWRAQGYTPQRISTFAIETYLTRLSRFDNAIAWTYEDSGHLYYVLYLPNADHHLVYDVAAQQWHKRALWDTRRIQWVPDIGRCHTFAFNWHLVGSRLDGVIYAMHLEFYQHYLAETGLF
jgi:hypothetical protein